MGVQSGSIVPLYYCGDITAILFLATINRKRQWSKREIDCATALGDALSNYLTRQSVTQQLQERELRYSYAMDASNDGLWDWNLLNDEIYFSPSYLRMLGYERNEIEPTFSSLEKYLIDNKDINKFKALLDSTIKGEIDSLVGDFFAFAIKVVNWYGFTCAQKLSKMMSADHPLE